MDSTSLELTLDIRKTYISKTMTEFLHHLSEIQDVSERLLELNKFIHKLEQETARISAFMRELPFCMLLLQDAMKALKEEEENIKKNMLGIYDLKEKETVITRTRSIFDFQPGDYYQNQMAILRKEDNVPRPPAPLLSSFQKKNKPQITKLGSFKISDGQGAFKPYMRDKDKHVEEEQQPPYLLRAMEYVRAAAATIAVAKDKRIAEEPS